MEVENKIKEVQALIDRIKDNSDVLNEEDRISVLELSVLISKITKLHEAALILKYLVKQEHGVTLPLYSEDLEEEVSVEEEAEDMVLDTIGSAIVEESKTEERVDEGIDAMVEGMKEDLEPLIKEEELSAEVNEPLMEEEVVEEIPSEHITEVEEVIEDASEEFQNLLSEKEPETDFFDEILNKEASPISISDIESKEELVGSPDINERFSDENDSSISGHLQKQPITDLIASIGLNERYLYASELFNGEMTDFKRSIQLLNDFETGEEAKAFFTNELRPSYEWGDDNELATALYNLVKRRYL